jgi:hypothetical protein
MKNMHAIISTQKPKHIRDKFTAEGARLISPKYMYANAEINRKIAAIKCFISVFLRFLIVR